MRVRRQLLIGLLAISQFSLVHNLLVVGGVGPAGSLSVQSLIQQFKDGYVKKHGQNFTRLQLVLPSVTSMFFVGSKL